MLLDTSTLGFDVDPERILREYKPGGKALMLAARVTGKLHSAFPEGAPPVEAPAKASESQAEKAPEAPREHLAESTEDANLVVVADTDLLQDRFWVQVQNFLGSRIAIPTSGNGSFVVNALDNLAGSSDLISVRSRGTFTRPFLRLDAIRQRAERKFREKEQELMAELEATERKLADMQDQKQGIEALILSEAQQQAIAGFRSDRVRIRKELRDVRHALRKDIERIETWLKFINIGLVPILIGLGGLAALGWRSGHSRRAAHLPART